MFLKQNSFHAEDCRNVVTLVLPSPCKQVHTRDLTLVNLDSRKVHEVTRKSARSVFRSLILPWDQQAPKPTETMLRVKEALKVIQGITLPLSRSSELLISHTLRNCSLICNWEGGRKRSNNKWSCCFCEQRSKGETTHHTHPPGACPARWSGCEAPRAAAEHKSCRRTHEMAKARPCADGATLLPGPVLTSRHTQHHTAPHGHARARAKVWTPHLVFILLTKTLLLISYLSVGYNWPQKPSNP